MSDKYRDPIHGFIEVSDLENKIINSVPFQSTEKYSNIVIDEMLFSKFA